MRKREKLVDPVLGEIELVEPSFNQASALFDSGNDKKFGFELVKLSIYRNGELLFNDDLSFSEGQVALKYVGKIMDLCGFGGEQGK